EANVDRKWLLIDAEGKRLGRLASEVAAILRGKHKPTYTPHADTGDYVIIANAEKGELTGNKINQKMDNTHSNSHRGLKEETAYESQTQHREQMRKEAVRGM